MIDDTFNTATTTTDVMIAMTLCRLYLNDNVVKTIYVLSIILSEKTMKANVQIQVEALIEDVQTAKTYITNYVTGNKLEASFYRYFVTFSEITTPR